MQARHAIWAKVGRVAGHRLATVVSALLVAMLVLPGSALARTDRVDVPAGDESDGQLTSAQHKVPADLEAPPDPADRILAVAYSDLDGNHRYTPTGGDVLISKLVDTNGDGAPSAGDTITTDQYPKNFAATEFGSFRDTSHDVTGVDATTPSYRVRVFGEYEWPNGVISQTTFSFITRSGEEWYGEARGGSGESYIWDRWDNATEVIALNSNGTSPSDPEDGWMFIYRENALTDDPFIDVEIFWGGPAVDSEHLVIGGSDHVAGLFTDRVTGSTWVDVRRVSDGSLVASVDFGSAYPGTDLEILDRGVGSPELVVLGTDAGLAVRATARDSVTGALVARANFGSSYSGHDLETVGLNKFAVLGTSYTNHNVRVSTRNLSDALVGNAFLGNAFRGEDLEAYGSNVAVMGRKYGSSNNLRVRVVDPAIGTTLGEAYFGGASVGIDLEVMGTNLAVLQERISDGNARVQVRTLTGTKVGTGSFGTLYTGEDLEVVGPNVAVLGTSSANQAVRVQTRMLDGTKVGTAQFGTGYSGLDFEVVNGDVAVLEVKANGRIRDQIRGTDGTVVATIYYN